MIKINLANRKQAASVSNDARVSNSGGGFGFLSNLFSGAKSEARLDGIQELPLRKVGALVAVGVIATFLLQDYQEEEIAKVQEQVVKVRDEQTRLKAEFAKTKEYDEIRKGLEKDEATLRKKIEVIQTLLSDRQASPKLLVALSSSIPADSWLRSVKIRGKDIELAGSSLGLSSISDFMKDLGANALMAEVPQLKGTQQGRDETGSEVIAFELLGKRR